MKTIIKTNYILVLLMMIISAIAQKEVEQSNHFEINLKHNYQGNNFNDITLTAQFPTQDTTIVVNGFYDGDQTFKIRFMPPKTGKWNYITTSNIKELNLKKGDFTCIKPSKNNHGMVNVSATYNFKYADGTNYYPFGTTAYTWTHMSNEIQEKTLNTLSKSVSNKLRMCVFSKDYNLVKEEPKLFPFEIKEIKIAFFETLHHKLKVEYFFKQYSRLSKKYFSTLESNFINNHGSNKK